jgi:hypothetical protein
MSRKKKLSFNSNFEGNGPEGFGLWIADLTKKQAEARGQPPSPHGFGAPRRPFWGKTPL